MFRKIVVGTFIFAAAVIVACGSESGSEFGTSSGTNGDGGTSSGVLGSKNDSGPPPPAIECNKMDIMFVVDNSPSMTEEQANLAKNFPEFIKVINDYKTAKGEELDYRVAVATSDDVADQGKFRKSRGANPELDASDPLISCNPGPNNNPWLERKDTNITDFFACRAQVGTIGRNIERPLESARLAVTDRISDGLNTMNGQSFVREDALLALVIITDEDEGSANGGNVTPEPLKDAPLYAADFDAVKIFRGRWASAVIAGDRGCDTPLGKAADAVRLRQFTTTVGKNGIFHSICDGDLTEGLKAALKTFTDACKDFPGPK
jgi:hypothetical protein